MTEGYLNTEPYAFNVGGMIEAYTDCIDFTDGESEFYSDHVIGFSNALMEQAEQDCVDFLNLLNRQGIGYSQLDPTMMGHNFWLTRNRHGAGFWDLGLGELGDKLTDAAHSFGEQVVYEGDDHFLYVW